MRKNRIGSVLADLRARRYLDAYAGWFLGLVVVTVDIVSAFISGGSILQTLVSATIVLLLGVITLATAEIRHAQLGSADRVGNIWRFYGSRQELPSLDEQARAASKEWYIFGLQLGQVVHDLFPTLEESAKAGCKIRLALLSPVDHDGNKLPWIPDMGLVHRCPNLDEVLRANLRSFLYWHQALPAHLAENISIRVYMDIPTASVMLVNPEANGGYIHVEPILYRLEPTRRPSFWLREADDPGLYRDVFRRYLDLWTKSVPLSDVTL